MVLTFILAMTVVVTPAMVMTMVRLLVVGGDVTDNAASDGANDSPLGRSVCRERAEAAADQSSRNGSFGFIVGKGRSNSAHHKRARGNCDRESCGESILYHIPYTFLIVPGRNGT